MIGVVGVVLFLMGAFSSALGSSLLLRASFLERRGALVVARRVGRTGGFLLAAGSALQALSAPCLLSRPFLGALAVSLTLTSGFVGLLGGLAGKPRPSGLVAATLWITSVLLGLRAAGIS